MAKSSSTPLGRVVPRRRVSCFPFLVPALCLSLSMIGAAPAHAQDPQQLQQMLKKLQEIQKSMGTMEPPEDPLLEQCTGFDKANPRFACIPVTITVTDDIDDRTWEREPSGLLPNRKPLYISHLRQLTYTARGKGKLLYRPDYSEFYLLAGSSGKTTQITRCVSYEEGYHFVGPNARPVRYHSDLMTGALKVHTPVRFSIQHTGPFKADGPAEAATKNYILQPIHIVLAANASGPDQFGSQLPNENVTEETVTPEKMRKLVADRGFEKSYHWVERFVKDREKEEHWLTIKVRIGEGCTDNIRLAIRTSDGQDRYVYTDAKPGKLELRLQADVTPAALADQVKWELPDIEGVQRQVSPASGLGRTITVTYTGLPASANGFGPKAIKATVDKDECHAEAETEVKFFFPRDAQNNPGGGEPNWFYYWKQTPAAIGPARYDGTSARCADLGGSHDLGYYRNTVFDSVYYICDLRKLNPDFAFNAKQLQGPKMIDVKVTGIDTFAVASLHENAHYRHFTDWWKRYRTTDKFLDQNHNGILDDREDELDKDHDLVPDSLEDGLHVDPTRRNTYGIGPDGDDEEFLCWMAEAGWKIGSADKQDWAKPGKQWK